MLDLQREAFEMRRSSAKLYELSEVKQSVQEGCAIELH